MHSINQLLKRLKVYKEYSSVQFHSLKFSPSGVTYIRKVIGDATWSSFIPTPNHPEYPAAHAVVSAAAAEGLTAAFGDIGPLTDHTWDYIGFPARTFNTFHEFALDAGNSRFYGGIHYQPSINTGLKVGTTVGDNVVNSLSRFTGQDK